MTQTCPKTSDMDAFAVSKRRTAGGPTDTPSVTRRRSQMPKIHLGTYDKALRGRSMAAGIKAFCLECCGWQKEEVRRCTAPGCPLYLYRPYRD